MDRPARASPPTIHGKYTRRVYLHLLINLLLWHSYVVTQLRLSVTRLVVEQQQLWQLARWPSNQINYLLRLRHPNLLAVVIVVESLADAERELARLAHWGGVLPQAHRLAARVRLENFPHEVGLRHCSHLPHQPVHACTKHIRVCVRASFRVSDTLIQ